MNKCFEKDINNENTKNCRICLGTKGKLISPCTCKGTMKYIHKKCLENWILYRLDNNKKSQICEICNKKYIIKRGSMFKCIFSCKNIFKREQVKPENSLYLQ